MTRKINSRTSLTTIKKLVQNDFGQKIDNGTAKVIKDAARKGALLWSSSGITSTMLDGGLRITENGVYDE